MKNKKKRKLICPEMPSKGQLALWFLRRALKMFLVFSILLLLTGFFFKNSLIFHPVKEIQYKPQNYHMPYEERWLNIEGEDAKVLAWRIPRPPDSLSKITILLFQGNSGNMSMMLDRLYQFHLLDYESFIVDYPGYGASPGRPSEKKVYQAAESLWQWAKENKIEPENIIVYGFSLGGGVASYLAANENPGGLILDSSFTRLRDVPSGDFPALTPYLYLILGNNFDTQGRLSSRINSPLLIIHSLNDDVVPYELGVKNFEIYKNTKEMIKGKGDHLSFLLNQKEYLEGIKRLADFISNRNENNENTVRKQ